MAGCSCCDCGEKKVKAYFCPKCQSVNVGYVFRLSNLFGVMPRMECRDCGFGAVSFPILVARKNGTRTTRTKKKVSKKKVVRKSKKVVRKKK